MTLFGVSLKEAEEMTFREFSFKSIALRKQLIDKERTYHWQAWLNNQAQAQVQSGKKTRPRFQRFSEFFDASAYEKAMFHTDDRNLTDTTLINKLLKANL